MLALQSVRLVLPFKMIFAAIPANPRSAKNATPRPTKVTRSANMKGMKDGRRDRSVGIMVAMEKATIAATIGGIMIMGF